MEEQGIKSVCPECIDLLVRAQQGDSCAEDELLITIQQKFMPRRIAKYINRNRLADNDDVRQEFMIGCAFAIKKARLDVGDPILFIISKGMYRVTSYIRKTIISGTVQVCGDCGHKSRLNPTRTGYQCHKCGSMNVTAMEINNNDETELLNISTEGFEENVIDEMSLADFKATLTPGTNVYKLYEALVENGCDRDNPLVKNYIKEIATAWHCSTQCVVINMQKLQDRFKRWSKDQGMACSIV